MITAPYNFVPLNEKVFYPDWEKDVSHDIPFEDGESGIIEIDIEAKSPIFIRNHSNDKDKQSTEFCHQVMADGSKQFYIPGSSIKGMVRNVMEIMSFAKMEFVNDDTLSVRDMTPKVYCQDPKIRGLRDCPNNLKKQLFKNDLVATANGIGLLKLNDDGTGTFIDYSIVEEKYKGKKTSHIRTIKFDDIGMNESLRKKTFNEKYNELGVYKKIKVKALPNPQGRRYIAKQDTNGEEAFVFFNSFITGRDGGKKYEFVLCESDKKNTKTPIDNELIRKFKATYFKQELPKEKKDWDIGNFWQNEFKNNPKTKELGIPVFVKKSNNGNITAIGLTQIFKLAYNNSIKQAIKQNIEDKLDLPQTIFGTVKENFALRGRVQFSHLASTHVRFEKDIKEEVLGTPNPSYYPNYIEHTNTNEDKVNHYTTLMDSNISIRGYKRYPLRSKIKNYPLPKKENGTINHDVTTKFKPLEIDTKFRGKVRFHNLKKAEIGALLSAITLHGKSDTNYHNIGMAKSLGYGKIQINLDLQKLNYTQEEYLKAFEDEITKDIPEWRESKQLKELFAMTDNMINNDDKLVYQQLKNSYGKNDFVEAKKKRAFLQPYSSFTSSKTKPTKNEQQRPNNHPHQQPQSKPKQQHVQVQQTGISKTKMRKAVAAYWDKQFGIFFHQNQIKEFFSASGFETTPKEQQEIYNSKKDDEKFIDLLKMVQIFFDGKMDELAKETFYDKITKDS